MKFSKEKVIKDILENIELIQEHIKNVHSAGYFLSNKRQYNESTNYGTLSSDLYKLELDEWRKLGMWGLTLDDKERDRIKSAMHQRFLKDNMYIGDYLSLGPSPGSWYVADEEEFRKMAKEAFYPNKE